MKARKKIPTFKDEDEEREFWSKAERVTFPNLRPSLRTISLRLPEAMIAELKLLANKRDVPYQSLLKVFLAERIREELAGETPSRRVPVDKRAG